MATLISTASGNINATGTWSVVDATGTNAFLNSETANTALTTSLVASSTFTPAAVSITAFGVKLASVAASPTGTLTLELYNDTTATVIGSRTVNVADLVTAAAASLEGGWIIVTCSEGTVAANGTDNFTIRAKTSSASQVNLFSLATTNWSRLLVTTGTQVNGPAAGDSFLVCGNLTGAGTHNSYTVTVNTTSNIDYGNVANTLVSPSIAIGQFGTLAFANAASTNYAMQCSGPLVIYNGGVFSVGTSGSPIPRNGTATLTLDTTVKGDTGITVRNGGTLKSAGLSRTSGKNVSQTRLSALAALGANGLTVLHDTGWLSGDTIVVAPTDTVTTTAKSEKVVLSGNAGASTIGITTTLARDHLGRVIEYTSDNNGVAYSMPNQAEVILLTRNVVITGASNAAPAYIFCANLSICSFDWTEFQYISGNATNQFGLQCETIPGGTFSLTNCSQHDSLDAAFYGASGATWGGTPGAPLLIQDFVMYNVAQVSHPSPVGVAFSLVVAGTNPNWVIDKLTMILVPASNYGLGIGNYGGQFTDIRISDCLGTGGSAMRLYQFVAGGQDTIGNWGPFSLHSNGGFDVTWSVNGLYGTINGIYTYHSYGWFPGGHASNVIFDPFYGLGNRIFQGGLKGNLRLRMRNGFLANDAVTGSRPGFGIDEGFAVVDMENMELGPTQITSVGSIFVATTNHSSIVPVMDIAIAAASHNTLHFTGRNTSLLGQADGTLDGQMLMSEDSFVSSDWIGNHKTWMTNGLIQQDTVVYRSAASPYSMRLTPVITKFTGYIAATVLTVAASPAPTPVLSVTCPLAIFGSGVVDSTIIVPGGTGLGGAGTYTVNISQTVGSVGAPIVITGPLNRMQSAPPNKGTKVCAAAGSSVQIAVWVRLSSAGDASGVDYNSDAPRLILRKNPYMGVSADQVLDTFSGSTVGEWQQLTGTTNAAPHDGEFEFVVDCSQTASSNAGGWINAADWTVVGAAAKSRGGQQFWFNGMPADVLSPGLTIRLT